MDRRHFLSTAMAAGATGALIAGCEPPSTGRPEGSQLPPLSLVAGGYTPDDFARYVKLRLGDGDPVYWYGIGDASTFPDGKMFMRTEGYDTGRLLSFDAERSKAVGLTRKLVVLRDPASGEILTGPDGQPAWLSNFTYQLFRLSLKDGFLLYEVEQGAGPFRETVSDGRNRSEVQRYNGMTVYTTPVNYAMPDLAGTGERLRVWENYDFIEREHDGGISYEAIWAGSFPLPPFMGPGRSSMHGYFQRYDNYADVPATLRDFVEEHAQMWKQPPRDMDEIRELQS